MNNKKIRAESRTCLLAVAAIFLPLSARAAAPVYFDLGGLLLFGALYVLGLIIFPIVIGFSKDKRMSSWLFAAYVIGPVLYIGISIQVRSLHNKQVMKEFEDANQKSREAFGKYCKTRKQTIHAKVKPADDMSLAVRIDQKFTGVKWHFNTHLIAEYMNSNPEACKKTGVHILEGFYDGTYSAEKKGYEPEIRRYPMCTGEKWTVTNKSQSRYELILGETSRRDPVPGNSGGRWMSASSARIVDSSTGAVLAEDTMYFLRYDTGEGGCPSGLPQLSELMAGVFGPQ